MKKTITILFFLIVELGFAQLTIKKSSIDSGGALTQNGQVTMLQTVGEVVIQENTTGTIHISEGFINANILSSLGVDNYDFTNDISIYPNPTVDWVNIHFENIENYEFLLTDLNGKQLLQQTKYTDNFQLDLSIYENAVYFLVVINKNSASYKTFKIIKK